MRLLRRWRPHLVIGAGGYVMGPAVLAATLLRQPRVIMEQNLIPGLTVRALARYAHRVFTSFPESQRICLAGRCSVQARRYARTFVPWPRCPRSLTDARLHLLVFGGSQGAHRINQAHDMRHTSGKHQHQLTLVHQTGEADCDGDAGLCTAGSAGRGPAISVRYGRPLPLGRLVLCRAGASTLAELTACGKPAILVPYPYAADNHQRHNAMALQRQGAAQVILDADLTGARLYRAASALLAPGAPASAGCAAAATGPPGGG